jgi:hypothetical protein
MKNSEKPQYVVVSSDRNLNISWRSNYACEVFGRQHPNDRLFGGKSRKF